MKRKWVNSFTVAAVLTLVSAFIYSIDLRFIQMLELQAYDFKVLSRGERDISGDVVIVGVDEKSLKAEGRWPWPRTKLARLVDRLSEAGAAAIGFDIIWPEKDIYVPFETIKEALKGKDLSQFTPDGLSRWLEEVGDSDTHFAKAIERSDRTVLGYFVYPTEESAAGTDAEKVNQSHLDLLDFSQYSIVQRSDPSEGSPSLHPIYAVGMSLPKLMDAASSAGFVSYISEKDDLVRWVPMVMEHGEYLFPSLSLQLLQQATQLPLAVRIAPYGVDSLRLGDTVIPASDRGDFLVNYFGPAYTFTHYSATDVLSGKTGAAELQNKIVLVGGTAAAMHDIHASPFGPFPGVEGHAHIIESIIQEDYLMRPEWLLLLDLLVIIFSGLVLGIMAMSLPAYSMALFLFVGISGYLAADWYLFTQKGIWIHAVFPVLSQIFVYSGITLYRFIFDEREKRFIKGAFGQYLSPKVVEQLVDDPSMLKLGGERKVLTAFFSDVAGFSKISESLSPDQLVELLNNYLTEMTDILMNYDGTVDKFEGDAIISFFGAPVHFKDHARRCCFAALDMQKRLSELRTQWKREGKHELFVRIGLNTGPMVVGNMGSKTRMDYTMMGDSVNLAARLEGVNKQYMTSTMISEFTYEEAKDDIEVRELDSIRVVGKKQPVRIYELIGRKGEVDDKRREILPEFNKGLEHYKKRQWEEGITCFENILNVHDDDGPSLVYFDRCIMFQNYPPDDD
ncbi:MAG: adenylate/guanylate cyclase domain-containing protein, partial [Nitrospinae bacterium]|nr:adenylate/guanylate cyclase domain-containing protein [Nitrospinota bacterium]